MNRVQDPSLPPQDMLFGTQRPQLDQSGKIPSQNPTSAGKLTRPLFRNWKFASIFLLDKSSSPPHQCD